MLHSQKARNKNKTKKKWVKLLLYKNEKSTHTELCFLSKQEFHELLFRWFRFLIESFKTDYIFNIVGVSFI